MTTASVLELPVLPLRDVVVFPHMVIPLFVGREKSVHALESAMKSDKQILLVSQREASVDHPTAKDVYQIGCVATILQLLKLPDGNVKVLVEGAQRAKVLRYVDGADMMLAEAELITDQHPNPKEEDALMRSTVAVFDNYVKTGRKVPSEIMQAISGLEEPARLADTIASHLALKVSDKQQILELIVVSERLEQLMALMEGEIELMNVEKRIRGRVKRQMEKSQREYYLNEQMKAIQKELGEGEEGASELEDLTNKIEKAGMSKEAKTKCEAELKKLKMMSPMSAEATVVRSYLEWMLQVPWKKRSKVSHDLVRAQKILDEDHYGLDDIKERILEYLAVQQRVKKIKGPVLCLVGPPGVGKTSLGQSIARATGREFLRVALGGVRDEAEIRGHRRTYIGSLPGRVIQKLAKAGVKNPLFLLDEIDKMAQDFRGDPASALLEVLDPEQNHTFNDHYLEVDYDLSEIMFVCTANSMRIPAPLLDRMEVIRIPGYTEDEKINIAERYLLPKQKEANGLSEDEFSLTTHAIRDVIRYYTREAGVRNLEREIAKICRKVGKQLTMKPSKSKLQVTEKLLEKYLGVARFDYGKASDSDRIGEVTGLAWTEVGGELLSIEAVTVPGKGKTTFTGSLGDVMQESIKAAMTVVRSRSQTLNIAPDFYEKIDLHVHVPEGATPKDGPSAGIAMCTALVSSLTGIAVRRDVAMTGEITLRGEVLSIGGLKEKLLAAHRGGIRHVIIPKDNRRDLKEIPKQVLKDLEVHCVQWIDEVLNIALVSMPVPAKESAEISASGTKDSSAGSDLQAH